MLKIIYLNVVKFYGHWIDRRNNKPRVIKTELNIDNESEGVYLLYFIIKKQQTNVNYIYY